MTSKMTLVPNLPLSGKQKKLLKRRAELEASIQEVNLKIEHEILGKQRQGKIAKLNDTKGWYEFRLNETWRNIQKEEEKQKLNYLKKNDRQQYEQYQEQQRRIVREQYEERIRTENKRVPGEDKRNAGKVLMVFGILISLIGFYYAEVGVSAFGFIINMIGIGLLVSGNREQGRGTTIFGGGFISSNGGG